jgi:hypothetical protein
VEPSRRTRRAAARHRRPDPDASRRRHRQRNRKGCALWTTPSRIPRDLWRRTSANRRASLDDGRGAGLWARRRRLASHCRAWPARPATFHRRTDLTRRERPRHRRHTLSPGTSSSRRRSGSRRRHSMHQPSPHDCRRGGDARRRSATQGRGEGGSSRHPRCGGGRADHGGGQKARSSDIAPNPGRLATEPVDRPRRLAARTSKRARGAPAGVDQCRWPAGAPLQRPRRGRCRKPRRGLPLARTASCRRNGRGGLSQPSARLRVRSAA